MNNTIKTIILAIIVYISSAGISYALFVKQPSSAGTSKEQQQMSQGKKQNDYQAVAFDEAKPKTEACPLNGALYSKEQKKWWEGHRPLGVMIENHVEARPQSGLFAADVIYEAVAEGGITRFLAMFYCQDAGIVGPVRSARTHFIAFLSEYGENPLYAHVGGAHCDHETGSGCANGAKADALGQIQKYGWSGYNDLDQFGLSAPTYVRDETRLGRQVATEHTVYGTTTRLWEAAKKRGLTDVDEQGNKWDKQFVQYTFKDDVKATERPQSQNIHVAFWEGYNDFNVDWQYSPKENSYLRNHGNEAHKDRNTSAQLTAKNVVILYMVETKANDGYDNNLHLLYKTTGSGKATVFQNGQRIDGTWSKDDRTDRLKLIGQNGKTIDFVRGTIWFQVVPVGGVVEVK